MKKLEGFDFFITIKFPEVIHHDEKIRIGKLKKFSLEERL